MKCTGVKRRPIGQSDVFLKCQKFWVSRLRLHEQIPQCALLSLLHLHELTNKISLKTPWQGNVRIAIVSCQVNDNKSS